MPEEIQIKVSDNVSQQANKPHAASMQAMETCSNKIDRLSSLPDDILHHISRVLTQLHVDSQYSSALEQLMSTWVTTRTAGYQPLRGCCKRLTSITDNLRPSIFFHADLEHLATPYMCKLPHLKLVSIEYSAMSWDVCSSLDSLHSILPGLTSLTLSFLTTSSPGYLSVRRIDHALVCWARTLQHLELTKMTCTSRAETTEGGLRFLSNLPGLRSLVLRDVLPILELKDIKGCTSLRELTLWGCGQHLCRDVDLDLSCATLLEKLSCKQFSLNSLNLQGLTALRVLNCSNNSLKQLDVSTCTALELLTCNETYLVELDVSNNPNLQMLECGSLRIASLNVSGCTLLHSLYCDSDHTGFTELNISTCVSLHTLNCEGVRVETLDLSGCPNLKDLNLDGSQQLETLNLKFFKYLASVSLKGSSVVSLDLTGCTSLMEVDCEDSEELNIMCVSGCRRLRTLGLQGCGLQLLDLTGCKHLQTLDCSESPLTALDLSSCVHLYSLMCSGSRMQTLDVTCATRSLTRLECERCPLTVLCAAGCKKLRTLKCGRCPELRDVHIDGCSSLKLLSFEDCSDLSVASLALLSTFQPATKV